MKKTIITIDGPAASGKTSVSRGLAEKLGFNWVSTGAFYRGIAYVALQNNLDTNNPKQLLGELKNTDWKVVLAKENTLFFIGDLDVTSKIFDGIVGNMASNISPHAEIREYLLGAQRDLVNQVEKGLVAEGRDCGTVVFPQADYKFYLTADQQKRAVRRATEKGEDVSLVLEAQKQRDQQDSSRKEAPLQIPKGAFVVDATELNLEQVIENIHSQI